MKFKSLIPAVAGFSLGVLCFVLSPFYMTWAAQDPFLGAKHTKAGVNCSGCHKENPPKANAPTALCIACHGNNKKVAEKTAAIEPNPHDSHLGDADCQSCHHVHKASVLSCASCHAIEMKVP